MIQQTPFAEHLQVFHSFTQSDVLDGNLELVRDADDDASLGRSVQFGHGHGGHLRCQGKLLGLFEGILSGRSVQYEQHLVGSVGYHFLHHVLYLGQLVHQSHLVVQTSGRVYDDDISLVGYRRTQRIKSDRSRVGPHLLFDDRHSYPFTPYHQLFHGSGTEGVGGTQHHRFPGLLELVGQFTDGGSFSHSVHTHHHDDIRFLGDGSFKVVHVTGIVLSQQAGNFVTQNVVQFLRIHVFLGRSSFFDAFNDFQRSVYADIRCDEHLLQIIQHFVVHFRFTGDGTGYLAEHALFGFGQPLVQRLFFLF